MRSQNEDRFPGVKSGPSTKFPHVGGPENGALFSEFDPSGRVGQRVIFRNIFRLSWSSFRARGPDSGLGGN